MSDMELVIKIPEEIYKASQIIDVECEDVIQIPLEVIKNGTPLPKGHGDLIDVCKLIGKIHGVKSISAVLDAEPIIKANRAESEDKE